MKGVKEREKEIMDGVKQERQEGREEEGETEGEREGGGGWGQETETERIQVFYKPRKNYFDKEKFNFH